MTKTAIYGPIEADCPPLLRHDYPALSEMAEQMLASRQKRFPALVRKGDLTSAQAEAELGTAQAIAKDWHWVSTGLGERPCLSSLPDRIALLDTALATIADIAGQQGGFDDTLAHQAQCVIAMRWHYSAAPPLPLHFFASITHQLRAAREPAHA